MKYLHVYGQKFPHGEAVIVGTREALRELAGMIMRTLEATEFVERCEFMACDGEGYGLRVICADNSDLEGWVPPYPKDR